MPTVSPPPAPVAAPAPTVVHTPTPPAAPTPPLGIERPSTNTFVDLRMGSINAYTVTVLDAQRPVASRDTEPGMEYFVLNVWTPGQPFRRAAVLNPAGFDVKLETLQTAGWTNPVEWYSNGSYGKLDSGYLAAGSSIDGKVGFQVPKGVAVDKLLWNEMQGYEIPLR